MQFRIVLATVLLLILWTATPQLSAAELGGMAAAAGAKAAKPVVDTASSVAAVPLAAAEIIRLPMGALQVVLAPLPAITYADGFENIGRGIIAPFKLAMAVLSLPYDLLNAVGGACDNVSGGN